MGLHSVVFPVSVTRDILSAITLDSISHEPLGTESPVGLLEDLMQPNASHKIITQFVSHKLDLSCIQVFVGHKSKIVTSQLLGYLRNSQPSHNYFADSFMCIPFTVVIFLTALEGSISEKMLMGNGPGLRSALFTDVVIAEAAQFACQRCCIVAPPPTGMIWKIVGLMANTM